MTMQAQREGGFLLVGVIIFVLALTILGMSLYSLSGYEADFQSDALDSGASFYAAQGGLVMVQALLAKSPYRLSTAKTAVGYRGITYVNATQWRSASTLDSVGAINWDSTLTVTVEAHVRGGLHRLTAKYLPTPRFEAYKRLFTISGTSVSKNPGFSTASIWAELPPTIWIGDTCHVWQTGDDQIWASRVTWQRQRPIVVGDVAVPDVQGFYLSHATQFTPTLVSGGGGGGGEAGGEGGGGGNARTLRFYQHPAGTVGYYGTPDNTDLGYSYHAPGTLELDVQGTVVWELPRGLLSENELIVRSLNGAPATLVIVGSPVVGRPASMGLFSDRWTGIWFFGGFDVPDNVNIVLVSDGQVTIERTNNPSGDNERAMRLAIYANALYLVGPQLGNKNTYDHASDMDADGGVIDLLVGADALPRPSGALPGQFTLVSGSWRDLTP